MCLVLAVSFPDYAQTLTDSNLPIVIINTDGAVEIPDQPRVLATMKIIYSGAGQRNYVSDQNNSSVLNYNGRIEIEVRGSSSKALQKKQYSLTTLLADNTSNNNVSLLGMPKENDWILNGLAFDASLIRDYISYNLSRKIGNYAPRTQYCEVIINGDYRGLYVLQEKIKADDNRVDVTKIEDTDINFPDVTGGYITKADKIADQDFAAWTMSSYVGQNDVSYIHEMPKSTEANSQQTSYIKSQFDKLAAKANNTSLSDGYPSVIDIPSFVDFMIINELSANVDAYQFSTYFHKDRNGKLRAGPLWDLNLTYSNDLFFWGLDRSKTDTWQFNNGDNIGSKFWKDLFTNATYKCYLSRRWNELTQSGKPLNLTSLNSFIDETVALISEAAGREQQRWGTVGDHASQIDGIKNFLVARMSWMTSNLGSFSACATVQKPPLVISRIMYYPATSSGFPDSNDQEFMEITNNGNESVNLTGMYFSGTGFVYQFPPGSILQPQGVLQLGNDRETFRLLYGFYPFGEFTRNLNNAGQKLTLADGFGNVIDEVAYSNQAPWPNVSKNGYHMKLTDPSLDNSLGTNWIASNEPIVTTIVGVEDPDTEGIQLYPNPAENLITITSRERIVNAQLQDVHGRSLETTDGGGSNSVTFNLSNRSGGMYLLSITTQNKTVVRKVVKK